MVGMAAALAGSIFAATEAAFTPQGVVGRRALLTVTPQPGNGTLDLTMDKTDLLVAIVNEWCNQNAGYTVVLASAGAKARGGGAKLVGTLPNASTADTLDYSIKYGDYSGNLSGGEAIVTNATGKTVGGGVDKNLTITYSVANANLTADTYSDTLTLTIAPKE